jgi:hypothetical protein
VKTGAVFWRTHGGVRGALEKTWWCFDGATFFNIYLQV